MRPENAPYIPYSKGECCARSFCEQRPSMTQHIVRNEFHFRGRYAPAAQWRIGWKHPMLDAGAASIYLLRFLNHRSK